MTRCSRPARGPCRGSDGRAQPSFRRRAKPLLAMPTTQTLMRHAQLNTTAIYVQVSNPKHAEAIDRLDPFGSGR